MAVMNFATLNRTAQTRFLHQGHCATKTDIIQGINISTPKGTDCTPYYGLWHGRHFSRSQSHGHSHHDKSSSFRRHTWHSSSSHCSSSYHLLANGHPVTTCAITPTGIVASHPTLATSPTDITHVTPQTGASSLTPATPKTQHRILIPEKPKNTQNPQPP